MPYRVEWQVEKRIGKLTALENFSLEEIKDFAGLFAAEFLDKGESPVHLIADLSGMKNHPTHILQLREATAPFLLHPHMGWLVIYGSTPLVGYLATIITHVAHVNYRSALSVDDALKSLKRVDMSLG